MTVVLISTFILRTNRIQEGTSETLLWNHQDAFLFINVTTLGYQPTYFSLVFDTAKGYFGVSTPPDNRASSVLVFHFTGRDVETYSEKKLSLDFYTPIEGDIYANRQGMPFKWAGKHFEPVTGTDVNRIFQAIFNSPKEISDIGGWSKRDALSASYGEHRYSFTLSEKPMTLVVRVYGTPGILSIEVEMPGVAPQQIYSLDRRLRSVSAADYDGLFL